MKKVLTVVGARPQFIKASVVSNAILEHSNLSEVIVHTGQHFDANMSDIFFDQLGIPKPNYTLDINGSSHGDMTGRMLIDVEKIMLTEKPDCVMVYGDTNSTLAGALAATKLAIPIAHVEAGLRSFNMQMPEEVNRILTDRISHMLFCPTDVAVSNLQLEGFPFTVLNGKSQHIKKVGDVMQDSAQFFLSRAVAPLDFDITNDFILATIHRAENTDDSIRLKNILEALNEIAVDIKVVLPIHPRTYKIVKKLNFNIQNITILEPVGYLEMLWLLQRCGLVVTDSGGVQKEAYFMGKACVTLRDQTEWVELVNIGANELVGADKIKILKAVKDSFGRKLQDIEHLYGGGVAAQNIAVELLKI